MSMLIVEVTQIKVKTSNSLEHSQKLDLIIIKALNFDAHNNDLQLNSRHAMLIYVLNVDWCNYIYSLLIYKFYIAKCSKFHHPYASKFDPIPLKVSIQFTEIIENEWLKYVTETIFVDVYRHRDTFQGLIIPSSNS